MVAEIVDIIYGNLFPKFCMLIEKKMHHFKDNLIPISIHTQKNQIFAIQKIFILFNLTNEHSDEVVCNF